MEKLSDIIRAVYRKDLGRLQSLTAEEVNQHDEDGRTPLVHAVLASDADPKVVRLLIDCGADVNVADAGQRWTAMHFAARDQNAAIVRELLEAGATVDPVDAFGDTPLWRAVMTVGADLTTTKMLLAAGADPHRKNNHGSAPLDIAQTTGRADIVALFQAAA
jgi:ankyrin repeat protein